MYQGPLVIDLARYFCGFHFITDHTVTCARWPTRSVEASVALSRDLPIRSRFPFPLFHSFIGTLEEKFDILIRQNWDTFLQNLVKSNKMLSKISVRCTAWHFELHTLRHLRYVHIYL